MLPSEQFHNASKIAATPSSQTLLAQSPHQDAEPLLSGMRLRSPAPAVPASGMLPASDSKSAEGLQHEVVGVQIGNTAAVIGRDGAAATNSQESHTAAGTAKASPGHHHCLWAVPCAERC